MINLAYQDRDEGLILLDGRSSLFSHVPIETYTNQTGGRMCNHPEATGYFIYLPIPDKVKDLMCCTYLFNGEHADEGDTELARKLNLAFIENGISFKVERGEEAWLHGYWFGPNGPVAAIATWQNCD